MKKIILSFLFIAMITSCVDPIETNVAVIKGISKKVQQIEIVLYNKPPEINESNYLIDIDSSLSFSLEIPIQNLRFGFILSENIRYDFCLLPGDNIQIEIINDSIKYTGRGADKNTFLSIAQGKGLSNNSYYNALNKAEALPIEFPEIVDNFKSRQLDFLTSYVNKSKLEPIFIDYYETLNQLNYERQVLMYPDYYARRNKLSLDSLKLPKEFLQLCNFSNVINDAKTVSREYIWLLNELIWLKAKNNLSDDSKMDEWVSAYHQIIFDSLTNKTQEYVLVDWICTLLEDEEYYDTLAIEKFKSLNPDSSSFDVVEKSINFFNKRPNLIGEQIPTEFKNTVLLNADNKELLFGELLSSMKGKVVYLDIWASWCAPCKKEMPYSKQLKEIFSNKPIEFVYVSAEKSDYKNWERLFEISLTTQNQYVFKNGFDSKMLAFLKIQGVPNYMIFDKSGKLVSYNAPRPSDKNLEKQLVNLINE